MKPLLILAVAALLVGPACKRRKQLDATPAPAATPRASDAQSAKLLQTALGLFPEGRGFALSGNVQTDMSGQDVGAKVQIRMAKDSLVWMSASVFGIEAVRVLATVDSVYVMNRLEKTYTVAPLASTLQKMGLPIGLPALQGLLVGSAHGTEGLAWRYMEGTRFEATGKNNVVMALTMGGGGTTFPIQQITARPSDTVTATFAPRNFKMMAGYEQPTDLELKVSRPGDVRTALLHIDELRRDDAQAYPFNIPGGYTREQP